MSTHQIHPSANIIDGKKMLLYVIIGFFALQIIGSSSEKIFQSIPFLAEIDQQYLFIIIFLLVLGGVEVFRRRDKQNKKSRRCDFTIDRNALTITSWEDENMLDQKRISPQEIETLKKSNLTIKINGKKEKIKTLAILLTNKEKTAIHIPQNIWPAVENDLRANGYLTANS